MGYCPEEYLIYLTIDTHSPKFIKNGKKSLKRVFTYELHHAVRWGTAGYGDTLGGAILSEGLAGHVVLEMFNGDPEPWEMVGVFPRFQIGFLVTTLRNIIKAVLACSYASRCIYYFFERWRMVELYMSLAYKRLIYVL